MTVTEHAEAIHAALMAAEAAHPLSRTLAALHNRLDRALMEHGEAIGIPPQNIAAMGGGTPKT